MFAGLAIQGCMLRFLSKGLSFGLLTLHVKVLHRVNRLCYETCLLGKCSR